MASASVKRNKPNGYGHADVKDSVRYVRTLRRRSRRTSDTAFLKELRVWQRSRPS